MKKRNLPKKEQDQLQKLQRENEKLKRTIQSLRKQMARIDIDQYQNLKEIIESQDSYNTEESKKDELKKLKEKWQCHDCARDYLKLIIIPRLDGMFYVRRCGNCGKKTKIKKWNDTVEGIQE